MIKIVIMEHKVLTKVIPKEVGYKVRTRFVKYVAENGNILIWKTSKCFDEESVKEITGTVKEHNEFREVKQTVLTRCKVAC